MIMMMMILYDDNWLHCLVGFLTTDDMIMVLVLDDKVLVLESAVLITFLYHTYPSPKSYV